MEYQIVKSKFGKELLYVPSEKMLYAWKGRGDEYICYQHVLRDSKKKDHAKHLACKSRIRRLSNGLCERINVNIQHSAHPDHKIIASDKRIMEIVFQQCEILKENQTEDAHRIPNRHILQRQIARYQN